MWDEIVSKNPTRPIKETHIHNLAEEIRKWQNKNLIYIELFSDTHQLFYLNILENLYSKYKFVIKQKFIKKLHFKQKYSYIKKIQFLT